METTDGRTRSVWTTAAIDGGSPRLAENLEADVCVVGAGIAGLTTACLLAAEGRSVVVLDDGPPLGGESLRRAGHLNDRPDNGLRVIEKHHGTEGLKRCVQGFTHAIDLIERLAAEAGVADSIVRVPGYLVCSEEGFGQSVLQEEIYAGERIGYAVEAVARAPTPAGPDTRAMRFPNQARLDVGVYGRALLGLALRRGVRVFRDTRATRLRASTDDHGRPLRAETFVETAGGHRVHADWIASTTCSLASPGLADHAALHLRQAGYLTYAVALDLGDADFEDASFFDSEHPHHHARLAEVDGRAFVIAGGEDHKVGQGQRLGGGHPGGPSASTGSWPGRARGGRGWASASRPGPARSSSPPTASASWGPTPAPRRTA